MPLCYPRMKSSDRQCLDAFEDELSSFISRVKKRAQARVEEAMKEYEEVGEGCAYVHVCVSVCVHACVCLCVCVCVHVCGCGCGCGCVCGCAVVVSGCGCGCICEGDMFV